MTQAIVICTVTLANLLGLSVIAEGIEDATSIDLLRGMGCEEGQASISRRRCRPAEFGGGGSCRRRLRIRPRLPKSPRRSRRTACRPCSHLC